MEVMSEIRAKTFLLNVKPEGTKIGAKEISLRSKQKFSCFTFASCNNGATSHHYMS